MKIFTIIILTLVMLTIGQMSWSEDRGATQPAETQNMQGHMQDMKDQMKCMQQMGDDKDHQSHSEMMIRMEEMMDRMELMLSAAGKEYQSSSVAKKYRHDHRKQKD